jgi:hypothetical protein
MHPDKEGWEWVGKAAALAPSKQGCALGCSCTPVECANDVNPATCCVEAKRLLCNRHLLAGNGGDVVDFPKV